MMPKVPSRICEAIGEKQQQQTRQKTEKAMLVCAAQRKRQLKYFSE